MMDAQRIFAEHMRNPKPCPWRFDRDGDQRADLGAIDGVAAMSVRINDDWYSWKGVHMQGQNAEFGLLLSENTHFVDVANWFMPSEPVDVMTMETNILNHQITIRYAGGELVSIMGMANGTFGYPKELYEVTGNGGIVVIDHMLEVRTAGIAGAPARKTYPMGVNRMPEVGKEGGFPGWIAKREAACEAVVKEGKSLVEVYSEADKGLAHMLNEFVKELRGQRGPVSPVQDAALAAKICLASVKSFREKRIVRIDEI